MRGSLLDPPTLGGHAALTKTVSKRKTERLSVAELSSLSDKYNGRTNDKWRYGLEINDQSALQGSNAGEEAGSRREGVQRQGATAGGMASPGSTAGSKSSILPLLQEAGVFGQSPGKGAGPDDGDEGSPSGDPALGVVAAGKRRREGRYSMKTHWSSVEVEGRTFLVEQNQNLKIDLSEHDFFGNDESDPLTLLGPAAPCDVPAAGKVRCDLCLMYFSADSVRGVVSMKRVMQFRTRLGVEISGRRFHAPSYMYSTARLCIFCNQMFSASDEAAAADGSAGSSREASSYEAMIQSSTRLESLITKNEQEETKERNIAYLKPAFQSSTADGRAAAVAIDGSYESTGPDNCSRTRREYESWWEVDLGQVFPIKKITVMNRWEKEQRSYRLAPFWIFVCKEPQRHTRLHDAKKSAVAAFYVDKHTPQVVWDLPADTFGACVRVQVENVKSLQLAQLLVVKGGSTVKGTQSALADGASAAGAEAAKEKQRAATLDDAAMLALLETSMPGTRREPEVRRRNLQPSNRAVLRVRKSNRVPPSVANHMNVYENGVDSLYWRTCVRYDVKDQSDTDHDRAHQAFTPGQLEAIQELWYSMCEVSPGSDRAGSSLAALGGSGAGGGASGGGGGGGDGLGASSSPGMSSTGGSLGADLAAPNARRTDQRPPVSLLVCTATQAYNGLRRFATAMVVEQSTVSLKKRNNPLHEIVDAQDVHSFAVEFESMSGLKASPSLGDEFILSWSMFLQMMLCVVEGRASSSDLAQAIAVSPKQARTGGLSPGGGGFSGEDSQFASMTFSPGSSLGAALTAVSRSSPKSGGLSRARTAPHKLLRSELKFNRIHASLDWHDPLVGDERLEYNLLQQRRREKQRTMMSDVEPAEIAPLVQYKSCGLCVRKFPIEALTGSVSVASMSVLLSKWHLSVAKFNARLESSNLSKYHRISLCVFCAQFFDPDKPDGLARTHAQPEERSNFVPFFDDLYPTQFSVVAACPPAAPPSPMPQEAPIQGDETARRAGFDLDLAAIRPVAKDAPAADFVALSGFLDRLELTDPGPKRGAVEEEGGD